MQKIYGGVNVEMKIDFSNRKWNTCYKNDKIFTRIYRRLVDRLHLKGEINFCERILMRP